MDSFKQYLEEARVSIEEKPLVQVTGAQLPALLGKGAFNSLIKHPWMKDWTSYEQAWKHGVDRTGFHIVEMYPYMTSIHKSEKGIRPEFMFRFTISHFGGTGKVVQVQKFHRGKDDNTWRHVKDWKVVDDE